MIGPRTGAVHSVAFSADGKRLASASRDGTVKVWGTLQVVLKGHHGEEQVTFSGHLGGSLLVAGSLRRLSTHQGQEFIGGETTGRVGAL